MLRRTFYVSSPTARKAHQILYILILTRVLSLSVQAASPFPSWTFQFPNYKMEWNEKPPIDIRMEQTIDNWADYDSVVVVVLKDPSSTKENTNATKDLEMGMFFEDLDTCNMGILSKWMEKSELTKGDHFISDHRAKKTTEQEWVEVSKVCKVDLNGTMRVQRLIIYRIKEDNPIYVAAKMGRDVGKKLAAQLSKCEPGERWAFLLPPPPCIEEEILSLKEDDTSLPKNRTSPLASDFISEMITTLVSDLYKDNRFRSSKYKSKKKSSAEMPEEEQAPLTLDVVWDQPVFSYGMEPPVSFVSKGREALKRGKQMASGIYLAKDIVNAPHNVLNSLSLAETAKRLASAYPRLHVNVLNSEDCERHSMGAYLGVARGSETPPQFIHIIYRPPGKSRIPL